MCDNLSLYKTYIPSSTTPQFYPLDDDGGDEQRPYMNNKRKLSDYEDNNSSLVTYDQISTPFIHDNIRNEEEDDEDEDDEDEDASSEDDETASDEESTTNNSLAHVTTPCTIIQRRHSDTIPSSYSSPIVKRRCTYSSMHDEEQKRSVLIESYRKLRGVKKPKLQVSLLICNLIKQLEKTFAKTPQPFPSRQQLQQQQQQQQQHVQYYQQRTTYRSSSSDSIYMSQSSLINDELTSQTTTRTTATTTTSTLNQQYSPPHPSTYDSDKTLIPVGDLRTSHTMYHHPSTTDAYWLAQSNFAIPVVSTSDDDDVDVSLQGGGDYLDLSDNTLASSFSSCSSSSPSVSSSSPSSASELISNDCCCSSTSSTPTSSNKLLVDTNNNTNDDYYLYQQQTYHHHQQHQHHYSHYHSQMHFDQDSHSNHHHSSSTEQAFFYHHNGTNTVDIITTA